MQFTTNPIVGEPGNGTENWGQILNKILDELKNAINTFETSISGLPEISEQVQEISEIKANISNISSTISNLSVEKNEIKNNISVINTQISTIENTLNYLSPVLDGVEISSTIGNINGGIKIIGLTTPMVQTNSWRVRVSKNNTVIAEVVSSSNHIFIQKESLPGVAENDVLEIRLTVYSGQSSKSESYNHIYKYINSEIEERLYTLENQLTIGNIIDSFAQDADALQALANVLHSSNTLAQKVAELNR